MLCENCKTREATTHVKQTVNGRSFEAYLCPKCYGEIAGNFGIDFPSYGDFSFSDFFDGLFTEGAHSLTQRQLKKCDFCGSTFDEIARLGRVGCHKCYEVFSEELEPTLRKIHGKGAYAGELPKSASGKIKAERKLSSLKEQLDAAVKNQEFEKAAKLRDEIRAIEAKEEK